MATYYQRKVVSDEFFVLHAGKHKEVSNYETRFGFVVSKKIHKRAVVRNKLKRRMREVIFEYLKNNETPYVSVILSAKTGANELKYNEIQLRITSLIKRVAIKNF